MQQYAQSANSLLQFPAQQNWVTRIKKWAGMVQVYEVNRKLLQEHAAPLMAVYLHGVAVVRQELNMDVGGKSIKGMTSHVGRHPSFALLL